MERVRELLESKTDPPKTEVAFSCTSAGRGVHVVAWDLCNGAIRKTYKSDSEGEGGHLCMAGIHYLLCALKSRPFILVWKIDKVQERTAVECDDQFCRCLEYLLCLCLLGVTASADLVLRASDSHGLPPRWAVLCGCTEREDKHLGGA